MCRRCPSIFALAFSAAALLGAAAAPAAAQEPAGPAPRPCEDDPRHGQLDFWVGQWRVVGDGDRFLGRSRVEKRHGGCVIAEEWTSARSGVSGASLSFVDPSDGRWRQVWVGSGGLVIHYEAELRDGAMRFHGRLLLPDGTVRLSRMALEPLEEGRVRQRLEGSADGGVTWTRDFEGTYLPEAAGEGPAGTPPAGAPPPAPPAAPPPPVAGPTPEPAPVPEPERQSPPAPAPAPAPPPPGQVVASSAEVPEEALPPGERQQVRLQSPMVLEVPVGPVEALPRGYSWRTAETAPYVVEGISIRRVTVTRAEVRGRVDVRVTVSLHAAQYLQRAALGVELLEGGESVARGELAEFPLGRSLLAQDRTEGLEKSVTLSLDRETFDRTFGGAERPVLRLTLTVPD